MDRSQFKVCVCISYIEREIESLIDSITGELNEQQYSV